MKNVIFGTQVEDPNAQVHFWDYDTSKIYSYEIDESNYAIVNTLKGYRLIKIEGYGKLAEDLHIVHREVVKVLKLEETGETNDDNQ